jgi:hypothetical protein
VSEQAEQTSHGFPDQPILAHWPYDDPTKVQGTAEQVLQRSFAEPAIGSKAEFVYVSRNL